MFSIYGVEYVDVIRDWISDQGVSSDEVLMNPAVPIGVTDKTIILSVDIRSVICDLESTELRDTITKWLFHAKYALKPEVGDIVYISYNKWLDNRAYRYQIAHKLGIKVKCDVSKTELALKIRDLYKWKDDDKDLHKVVDEYNVKARILDREVFKEPNYYRRLPLSLDIIQSQAEGKRVIHLQDHGALGESVFLAYVIDAMGSTNKYFICAPKNPILQNNPNIDIVMSVEEAETLGIETHQLNRHKSLEFDFRLPKGGVGGYGNGMDLIQMTKCIAEEVLGDKLPPVQFDSPIHLTSKEKRLPDILKDVGNYWVIFGTAVQRTKFWGEANIPGLIDELKDEITFVNVGISGIFGGKYDNCINLIDKTSIRETLSIIYNSEGVVSSVGAGHNLGCAVPSKNEGLRQVMGIFGGSEESGLYPYPNLHPFTMIGKYPCCAKTGCYQTGVGSNCRQPLDTLGTPPCYNDITPKQVASVIRSYNQSSAVVFQDFDVSTLYEILTVEGDPCSVFSDWLRSQLGTHNHRPWSFNYGFNTQEFIVHDSIGGYDDDGLSKSKSRHPFVLEKGARDASKVSGCSYSDKKRIIVCREFENVVAVAHDSLKNRMTSYDTLMYNIYGFVNDWRSLTNRELNNGEIRISFEKFVMDSEYRKSIGDSLGLENITDKTLEGLDLDETAHKWIYHDDYMIDILESAQKSQLVKVK